MAKLDEPVAEMRGIKPEIFGIETFAAEPVTDGGSNKDAAAAYGFE